MTFGARGLVFLLLSNLNMSSSLVSKWKDFISLELVFCLASSNQQLINTLIDLTELNMSDNSNDRLAGSSGKDDITAQDSRKCISLSSIKSPDPLRSQKLSKEAASAGKVEPGRFASWTIIFNNMTFLLPLFFALVALSLSAPQSWSKYSTRLAETDF
jgi:hypothetical protein